MIRKLDINDIDSYCNLRVAMLLSDKSVSYNEEYFKNKGYSKLLLNEVIEDAKKRGLTRFKLSSHNEIAIKMYEEFGFTKDGESMVKND